MSVPITFVVTNHEETLKRDFVSKYFLEVNAAVIRTNHLSMINNPLPSLFLVVVIIYL